MPDIELKKIQPNRLNPRLEFTKAGLDELSDSIKQVGLLEPIIVRQVGNQFEVVVGERRYRAAQQAGLHKVPVIIRHFTDEEVMELNLIENIQREALTAVEKGKVCNELLNKLFDMTGWSFIDMDKRQGILVINKIENKAQEIKDDTGLLADLFKPLAVGTKDRFSKLSKLFKQKDGFS